MSLFVFACSATAADIRAHTRLKGANKTALSQSQALDLTLTLSTAEVRPLQSWVRTAGVPDKAGKTVTAQLDAADARWISLGQRARAFSPDSKSSMYQAKITALRPKNSVVLIEATLSSNAPGEKPYLLEIVVDRGNYLCIPNEAIIEEGDRRIVYVHQKNGDSYSQRSIEIGIQGERYTQVVKGLASGEEVVTTGSFFIDSEHKMKGGE